MVLRRKLVAQFVKGWATKLLDFVACLTSALTYHAGVVGCYWLYVPSQWLSDSIAISCACSSVFFGMFCRFWLLLIWKTYGYILKTLSIMSYYRTWF